MAAQIPGTDSVIIWELSEEPVPDYGRVNFDYHKHIRSHGYGFHRFDPVRPRTDTCYSCFQDDAVVASYNSYPGSWKGCVEETVDPETGKPQFTMACTITCDGCGKTERCPKADTTGAFGIYLWKKEHTRWRFCKDCFDVSLYYARYSSKSDYTKTPPSQCLSEDVPEDIREKVGHDDDTWRSRSLPNFK